MKKVLAILLAVLFILPAAYAADPAKQLKKAKEKQRKEVMKRLKKEQWSLLGSSRSLEVALLSHWTELDALGADGKEIVGISTRTKSKNIGQQMATNAACINYAQEAGSAVKGRALTDMAGSGVDTDKEFENFYAAYERLVEKEIRGEMKQSFSLIRTNADGPSRFSRSTSSARTPLPRPASALLKTQPRKAKPLRNTPTKSLNLSAPASTNNPQF